MCFLYFFSASAQSLAALIATLGVSLITGVAGLVMVGIIISAVSGLRYIFYSLKGPESLLFNNPGSSSGDELNKFNEIILNIKENELNMQKICDEEDQI